MYWVLAETPIVNVYQLLTFFLHSYHLLRCWVGMIQKWIWHDPALKEIRIDRNFYAHTLLSWVIKHKKNITFCHWKKYDTPQPRTRLLVS